MRVLPFNYSMPAEIYLISAVILQVMSQSIYYSFVLGNFDYALRMETCTQAVRLQSGSPCDTLLPK